MTGDNAVSFKLVFSLNLLRGTSFTDSFDSGVRSGGSPNACPVFVHG